MEIIIKMSHGKVTSMKAVSLNDALAKLQIELLLLDNDELVQEIKIKKLRESK